MVLECFLDNDLPKTLSKGIIPLRRSLKKSKKHQAIAPAALGGCGGLGQLWEALGGPCGNETAQPGLENLKKFIC